MQTMVVVSMFAMRRMVQPFALVKTASSWRLMSALVEILMNAKAVQMSVINFASTLRAAIHAPVVTGFSLTRSSVEKYRMTIELKRKLIN